MEIVEENDEILIVTKNGYGKRTPEKEYRIQSRGGKGIKTCNVTEKNGELVAVKTVPANVEEDLMIITAAGVIIRMAIEDISKTGRSTQGVKLIRLENTENEFVSTVAIVEREEEKEDSEEEDEHHSTELTSEESTSETEKTSETKDEE
jgi:DNA gyrase subunit A